MNFEGMNICSPTLRAIKDLGYEKPMEIQAYVIPLAMRGEDVVGHSATGSGKTAAFGIPMLERVKPREGLQALILAPTRELALQITDMLKELGKYSDVFALPVYGGASFSAQVHALPRAEIVVGTPGRVLDHLRRGTMKLGRVKILVLDEADRMLDMGFIDDVEAIIRSVPRERQTMLFGATVPREVLNLSKRYMRSPNYIAVESKESKPRIEHSYIEVAQEHKFQLLLALLERENPFSAIIFCNTQKMAGALARRMNKYRFEARAIHGGLSQSQRERAMRNFRNGEFSVLVATDVASRGLDIDGVSHIINYDVPNNPEDYVHRTGRTARAGRAGIAFSLLSPRDHDNMRRVEQYYQPLKRYEFNDFKPEKYPAMDFREEFRERRNFRQQHWR